MNVEIKTISEAMIIMIEGSVDSKTASALQTQIMEKMTEADQVILDLSKVGFVSSAGLRLLLVIYR